MLKKKYNKKSLIVFHIWLQNVISVIIFLWSKEHLLIFKQTECKLASGKKHNNIYNINNSAWMKAISLV